LFAVESGNASESAKPICYSCRLISKTITLFLAAKFRLPKTKTAFSGYKDRLFKP
jgi:hypothetical protein